MLSKILSSDGYQRVESPKPGDVATYVVPTTNRIEHTGIVTFVDGGTGMPQVWVWSAWGALGEFCHLAHVSPYKRSRIEYWRLSQ
ncbi:MAG: hypothetical protein ACHREM_11760 [Polyangiales bacterium]